MSDRTPPPIEHEHVTNPRARIAAGSLWRVQDQTAAYLAALGPDATRRQLELRLEELGRNRRAPKAPGRPRGA